jgi:hypothetical protein
VNTQLEKRARTLQLLFTTKDVPEENREGWVRAHRDLVSHRSVCCPRLARSAAACCVVVESGVVYCRFANVRESRIAGRYRQECAG